MGLEKKLSYGLSKEKCFKIISRLEHLLIIYTAVGKESSQNMPRQMDRLSARLSIKVKQELEITCLQYSHQDIAIKCLT